MTGHSVNLLFDLSTHYFIGRDICIYIIYIWMKVTRSYIELAPSADKVWLIMRWVHKNQIESRWKLGNEAPDDAQSSMAQQQGAMGRRVEGAMGWWGSQHVSGSCAQLFRPLESGKREFPRTLRCFQPNLMHFKVFSILLFISIKISIIIAP